MPMFSLSGLKYLTDTILPLNIFADQPNSPVSREANDDPATSASSSAQARTMATGEAGPGPSTTAQAATYRAGSLTSSNGPVRPSLSEQGSFAGSSAGAGGGRRPSAVRVVDPEDAEFGGMRGRRVPRDQDGAVGMKAKKRRKPQQDTYIIVKPPPTASKNPLNLQIQLVVRSCQPRDRARSESAMSLSGLASALPPSQPPTPSLASRPELRASESDTSSVDSTSGQKRSARADSCAGSDDSAPARSADGSGENQSSASGQTPQPSGGTSRNGSRRSSVSGVSGRSGRSGSYSSSMISTAAGGLGSSAGAGGSSTKRIEPLFNLAVHNVMQPTVVTDASTDAKVAKFLKRGVDFAGLGVLEPSEVWLPPIYPSASLVPTVSNMSTHSGGLLAPSGGPRSPRPKSMIAQYTSPLSPNPSRGPDASPGRASFDLDFKSLRPDVALGQIQEGGAKKFFGKIFKKKGQASGPADDEGPSAKARAVSGRGSPSLGSPSMVPVGTSPSKSDRTLAVPSPKLGPTAACASRNALPPPAGAHAVVEHGQWVGLPTFGTAPLVLARRSSETLISPDGAITGLKGGFMEGMTWSISGMPPSGSGLSAGRIPTSGSCGSIAEEDPTTARPLQSPSILEERDELISMNRSSRPIGYSWSVKKWGKKTSDNWAAHLIAAAAPGIEFVGAGQLELEDEVVFEWVKVKVSAEAADDEAISKRLCLVKGGGAAAASNSRATGQDGSVVGGATSSRSRASSVAHPDHTSLRVPGGSRSGSPLPPPSPLLDGRPEPLRRVSASENLLPPSRRSKTPDAERSRSPAASRATTPTLGSGPMERSQSAPAPAPDAINVAAVANDETASLAQTIDDGEESDPEDSETPWACSVWVKKTGRRQLLGTLTPAPHHPKVIGVLKMATRLEPVPLTHVKPRSMATSTSSRSLVGPSGGGGIGLGFGTIRQSPSGAALSGGNTSLTTTPTRGDAGGLPKSTSSTSFLSSRESRETTPTPASPRIGSDLFSGFGTIRARKDGRMLQAQSSPRGTPASSGAAASPAHAPPQPEQDAEAVQRAASQVCMTEENLKDVVCVTAMWLVAREEFGGLGKVKRGLRRGVRD